MYRSVLVFLLCALTLSAWANPRVKLTENGGLLVDDKPFLPLFVWAQPSSALALHKSLGINALHPGESEALDPLKAYLDTLQANGMLGLIGAEAYRDELKTHPAILAWTVEHEPDMAEPTPYAPDLSKDPDAIWIEGEAAATSFKPSSWLNITSSRLSGGKWLTVNENGDWLASYKFTVKIAGVYHLWSREFTKNWANPTSWRFDDRPFHNTTRELTSAGVEDLGGGRGVGWCKYADVELTAGEHVLTIRVLPGRTLGSADKAPGTDTICALDAFCFTTVDNYPPAKAGAFVPKRSPEAEKAVFELMKQRDPQCLTWHILAAGFYGQFQQLTPDYYRDWLRWTDISSFDYYPITGWNQPSWLPQVGLATGKLVSLARKNQPVFAFIEASDQELSWTAPETKGPTAPEMRAEIWSAIANGARGIGYFTIAFGRGKAFKWNNLTDEIKAEMKRSNAELTELAAPIVLGEVKELTVENDQTSEKNADGHAIQAIRKDYQGVTYLIAVNVTRQPIDPTFRLPTGTAESAMVFKEDRKLDLKDDQFTDHFAPLAVHCYVVKKVQTVASRLNGK